MTALYQNKTIRQVENAVFQQNIATGWELMQRAGHASFILLVKKYPKIKSITVMCGKGNNAGDGFVLAHEAHVRGLSVKVFTLVECEAYKDVAKKALESCLLAGVEILDYSPECKLEGDVIVDALLGTGISGEVKGEFVNAIEAINLANLPVLSLDVPSGIDADTGRVHGSAVFADTTISFIGLKPGLYTAKAVAHTGELFVDDLAVPPSLFPSLSSSAELIDKSNIKNCLPKRKRDAYKGDFGHVLVIGGNYGMGGAVRMAAEAALRVGAGLVSVATRPEHIALVSGNRPEIMCHKIETSEELAPLLDKASVIVIGPGLGKCEWGRFLFDAAMRETEKPLIIDADALNFLSKSPMKKFNWVLTPHAGEAARLLNSSVLEIENDRYSAAKKLNDTYGGVCVLKGAGTIIQFDDSVPYVCPFGNPGMATAGMGDVLSGVIAGLLAQGIGLKDAAINAVGLHALAADMAANANGERGMLAMDLMPHLRKLVN